MQFKAIVLSTVLGLVAAQSSDVASLVAELPSCSLTCLLAGASAADCESMDYSCQCGKQDVIVANATSCLTSSCNTNDIASMFYSQQSVDRHTATNNTRRDPNCLSADLRRRHWWQQQLFRLSHWQQRLSHWLQRLLVCLCFFYRRRWLQCRLSSRALRPRHGCYCRHCWSHGYVNKSLKLSGDVSDRLERSHSIQNFKRPPVVLEAGIPFGKSGLMTTGGTGFRNSQGQYTKEVRPYRTGLWNKE